MKEDNLEYVKMYEKVCRLAMHVKVAEAAKPCYQDYVKMIENFLRENPECDLYEEDLEGRSALHVAVQFSNVEAVVALLMCGADVNMCDAFGKTAFTYCLESFNMSKDISHRLFFTFLGHVHKLIVVELPVNPENHRCYKKARARHVFNDKQLQIGYAIEIDKMHDVRVGPNNNLSDILYRGASIIATSRRRRLILLDILTAYDFYTEFPKFACLLKLQYRRALRRRKFIKPVLGAFELIIGFILPTPCFDNIFQLLDEQDLRNIIQATYIEFDQQSQRDSTAYFTLPHSIDSHLDSDLDSYVDSDLDLDLS